MPGDCLFCQIATGAAKAELVHEAGDSVAFLDTFPAARGHVLVIPRAHAATLLELDDAAAGGLFVAVKAVMRKVSEALHPVALHVGWNHGRGAGQHVFHLHVHVLPRFSPGRGVQQLGEGAGTVDLAALAESIRRA